MNSELPIKNIPCDLEPIHLINELQEYGALFIVNFETHEIIAVSENCFDFVSIRPSELLGKNIDTVLGDLNLPWDGLSDRLSSSKTENFRFSKKIFGKDIFLTLRRSESFLLIELELDDMSSGLELSLVYNEEMLHSIAQNSLANIYQTSVDSIRKLTKYDRVVLYHFFPDFSGKVIAESKIDSMDSILGYHYPSTDIPLPARKLYEKNPIRCINREQKAKIGLVRTFAYKDYAFHLGDTMLRAPHSHHIEYLTNMGIASSMSISIVCEGKLWGLFICHNLISTIPTPSLRKVLEVFSASVSMQIDLFLRNERISYALALESSLSLILKKVSHEPISNLFSIFLNEAEHLRNLLKSDGFYFCCLGKQDMAGEIPSENGLVQILDFLEKEHLDQIFITDQIGLHISNPNKDTLKFPGLISFPLSSDPKDRLLWFRKELQMTIDWAGNPEDTFNKKTEVVSPRTSFGKFIETVKGKSQAYSPSKRIALESFLGVREIIDKKRIEAQLALTLAKVIQSEKELQRLNQTKDKFFSIVSHNLRSPFGSLLGFSDLLLESVSSKNNVDTSELISLAKNLNSSSHKAYDLLKNLFEWGKIQQGRIIIQKTNLTFSYVLNEVIYNFSSKFKDKKIKFTLNCPEKIQIHSDYGALVQIFSHVINNSIKYSHRGSQVSCHVTDDMGHLFITIEDSGVGMSTDDLAKLFHIDSKFRNLGTEKEDGTGLGLIIVREYLNLLKGDIKIQSEIGKGTVVKIQLPINSQ